MRTTQVPHPAVLSLMGSRRRHPFKPDRRPELLGRIHGTPASVLGVTNTRTSTNLRTICRAWAACLQRSARQLSRCQWSVPSKVSGTVLVHACAVRQQGPASQVRS